MGVYWRTTMPLLSTLAALVIIVHSAEEDLEEYRRDLRPRILDAGTTKYDMSWRAVKVEPMMTQSTQTDTWDGSSEDPPKRRRPLRKRRRRPQGAPEILPEIYTERRQYRNYKEDNYRPLTEVPHRRRKKVDIKHDDWYDEFKEKERPFRGKVIKRKPEQEPWHEFSEFGDIPVDENIEANVESQKHETSNYEVEVDNNESREPRLTLSNFYNEESNRNADETADVMEEENEQEASQFPINKENEYDERSTPEVKEDKSLSEFSLESSPPVRTSRNKNLEESNIKENFNDKLQKKTLDAVSLKDILKQSNGKSLSELLQQHNLTLADLLNGEKKVLSILKPTDTSDKTTYEVMEETSDSNVVVKTDRSFSKTDSDVFEKGIQKRTEKIYITSEGKSLNAVTYITPEPVTESITTPKSSATEKYNLNVDSKFHNNNSLNETNSASLRRRYTTGVRMKLRMRPLNNNSYKGQLSRDMITSTTKRNLQTKNSTKFREWKELVPAIVNKTESKWDTSEEEVDIKTTTSVPESKTTTEAPCEEHTISTQSNTEVETEVMNTDTTPTAIIYTETVTEEKTTTTTKTKTPIRLRQRLNVTSLRQQAFTNRLKNKKLKQQSQVNETSQDNSMKNIFDMANLVSASEFIAKVQPIPTTPRYQTETETILEDFITTEIATKASTQKSNKRPKIKEKRKPSTTSTTTSPAINVTTTEEITKMEIEEILNDNLTSTKLTKILMERNMTLNELVEHRERGSSHVHLQDIFHNASKEPNPPEPFLSKSLIEPISKETYPLRALLEANSHESTMKPITVTTVPYISSGHYINIPIMMDFGNNVNENGENSGITSFINNFTGNDEKNYTINKFKDNPNVKSNNDLVNEKVEIIITNRTSRQSRLTDNESDLITLNEIFTMMHKNHSNRNNTPEVSTKDPITSMNNIVLEQDIDDDGLIILEDLQQINQYDSSPINHKMELKSEEIIETSLSNTPEQIHSNTRSVTVVTASIVGLIAVLFLLTYAVFKWKHQQQIFRNKHSMNNRIPPPVFENRTINKNSTMRSMSPMLSSSIYTINTLEKHNSNECEYMWDSLRKPFQ